jgi:N4-(beta-N-acetylglucosaminyl)-L-asparaginase
MSQSRKEFLKTGIAGLAGIGAFRATEVAANKDNLAGNGIIQKNTDQVNPTKPVVISTWIHGIKANEEAWSVLGKGGSSLDAVELGVKTAEADPENQSVGLGGFPDREGRVTLDACIMNHEQQCGSVAFLEHIVHPISVARKVMEETPHVMLVGKGALQFAEQQGFKRENLLTEASEKAWRKWLEDSKYAPVINVENHDTIGMLALDELGNLSGACTTSGAAYKMHGRVGDSPIIGAGLYLDNEIGGAVATGLGEAVIRSAGASVAVELMRQGYTPQQACEEVIARIISKEKDPKSLQVGVIALNKQGEVGGSAIHPGFNYALLSKVHENGMLDAPHLFNVD